MHSLACVRQALPLSLEVQPGFRMRGGFLLYTFQAMIDFY